MNVKHWGEIHERKVPFIPDVSSDIQKSMNKFCLAEFDTKLGNNENKTEYLELESMDPLIMYAISLHKYMNDMTEMVRVADLAIDSGLIPPQETPPIPEKPILIRQHPKNGFTYTPTKYIPFTESENIAYPELSNAIAKQILTKSVATMLAHIGYETTHESILLFLTDVLEEFFKKISVRLKNAREEELKDGLKGFPSYPEKVLIELGLGGMKGLHDYYENRVVKYINILYKRCEELNDNYRKLLIPQPSLQIDEIKIESCDMIDATEEITVAPATPGISSIVEGESIPDLSPYTKKKRSK